MTDTRTDTAKDTARTRKALVVIASVTVLIALLMWCFGRSYFAFWDTQTYVDAFDNILCDGVDVIRTPLYPMLLGLCRVVFGDALWAHAVVLVQLAAFIATIPLTLSVAQRLMKPRAAVIVTAVYAWCPTFVSFALFVMPDIWCVIGVVCLIYLSQRLLKRNDRRTMLWCTLTTVALVFLKPSNIYLSIWWGVIALILLIYRQRQWWQPLVVAAVPALLLGGYGLLVQRQLGYYSVSIVSDINDLGNAAQRRKLVPELASDSITAKLFRDINACDSVPNLKRRQMAFVGTEHLTQSEIHRILVETKAYDPARWYRGIVVRLFESLSSNAFPIHGSEKFKYYAESLHISFYVVYLVLLAIFVRLIIYGKDIRRQLKECRARAGVRAFQLQLWALWILVCGGIATAVIGGFDDFGRLSMGAYPALIILCGAVLSPRSVSSAPQSSGTILPERQNT